MRIAAPKGYIWKLVTFIEPGDFVHRWGDDLCVLETHIGKFTITLDVQDGGQVKSWEYKLDDELLVKHV